EGAIATQTIPGPNIIFHSGVNANPRYKENPVYDSLEDVANAIAILYQNIIQTFYDHGCRYLQLDDTSWGAFFSDKFRETIRANGYDPEEIMKILDRKSTGLNSSHVSISYAVFCLKKKKWSNIM